MKEIKKPQPKPEGPHKPKIEDEKLGQSAVGKHTKTQHEQNEERDLRAAR